LNESTTKPFALTNSTKAFSLLVSEKTSSIVSPLEARAWNTGIAASGIVFGGAIAFEMRPSPVIAALVVGCFAIFHGRARGTELPPGQSALLYRWARDRYRMPAGGRHRHRSPLTAHRWTCGRQLLRSAGTVVAAGGIFFLWKAIV